MKPFAEARGDRWTWKRPRLWSRRYELRAATDVLASLEARALLGSSMVAEAASGRWAIRHVGLLRGRVTLTAIASERELVTFRPRWFGAGDVTTAAGQTLRWHRADFWGRRWEMVDTGGLARVAFVRSPAFLSADTDVVVSELARTDPELAPLVVLGFYLILIMARQSHAAI